MSFEEEINHVKKEHPRVWAYLLGVDALQPALPKFDDNDDMYFTDQERRERDGKGIFKSRPCA